LTSTAEFSALLDKKAELEEQIKSEAKEVFAASAKEIFEEYGDRVGVFGWQQYTPYFNDGDPCEFSKGEIFIYTPEEVADPDIDISYWESEGVYGYNGNPKYHYRNKATGNVQRWEPYRDIDKYEKIDNPDYDSTVDYSTPKEAVLKLCTLIDEDTALALFGDHTTVIVTPEGVETQECSHD
jgi:hypothetical protein